MNLAKICERYGGGGHARVGAISFEVTQQKEARKAASEIVEELRAAVRAPGPMTPTVTLSGVSRKAAHGVEESRAASIRMNVVRHFHDIP